MKKTNLMLGHEPEVKIMTSGALAPLAAPKFFLKSDHTHICYKVCYSEGVALFTGSVAPNLREKNESTAYSLTSNSVL